MEGIQVIQRLTLLRRSFDAPSLVGTWVEGTSGRNVGGRNVGGRNVGGRNVEEMWNERGTNVEGI